LKSSNWSCQRQAFQGTPKASENGNKHREFLALTFNNYWYLQLTVQRRKTVMIFVSRKWFIERDRALITTPTLL
jgi:hypothetical protein